MEWEDFKVNLSDLNPSYRIQQMEERSKCYALIPQTSFRIFCNISNQLLEKGNDYMKNNKSIEAFETFMKYQYVVNKIKKHREYKTSSSNTVASFDYNMKTVTKKINSLKTELYFYFNNIYKTAISQMEDNRTEAYGERRSTDATIATFINNPAEEASHLDRKPSISSKRVKSSFEELPCNNRIVHRLRTLTVPDEVETAFSYLSFYNNQRNIVTVGVLAGTEIDEKELTVTHLIIPKQMGQADSFEILAPEEVTTLLEEANIEILGWIQSKPCGYQTYMSSTDLHYHYEYQKDLPEAVAIVYSPRKPEFVAFNLTPDHGLSLIGSCSKTGPHVHPTQPQVYMKSQHVFVEKLSGVCKFDLRKNVLACTYNCSCLPQLLDKKNS